MYAQIYVYVFCSTSSYLYDDRFLLRHFIKLMNVYKRTFSNPHMLRAAIHARTRQLQASKSTPSLPDSACYSVDVGAAVNASGMWRF